MAPLRNNRDRNRSNRGQIDHDIMEGLPVRQWRKQTALVNKPPAKEAATVESNPNDRWKELSMPRGSELYPPHSQALLRAARMGQFNQKPARPAEDDKENGDDEDAEGDTDVGYIATRWAPVPKDQDLPEPEFLAKRRKGLPSLHDDAAAVGANGAAVPMRKVKVRKIGADGNATVFDVLAPEGVAVEGEIVEGDAVMTEAPAPGTVVEGVGVANEHGVVIATEPVAPTLPRRRPPPPKRKNKGPGRGRKKRPMIAPGVEGAPTGLDGASEKADVAPTSTGHLQVPPSGNGVGSGGESPGQDGEEGSDDDDDEGDEGEDGESGDDGATPSRSPSKQPPPVSDPQPLPTQSLTETPAPPPSALPLPEPPVLPSMSTDAAPPQPPVPEILSEPQDQVMADAPSGPVLIPPPTIVAVSSAPMSDPISLPPISSLSAPAPPQPQPPAVQDVQETHSTIQPLQEQAPPTLPPPSALEPPLEATPSTMPAIESEAEPVPPPAPQPSAAELVPTSSAPAEPLVTAAIPQSAPPVDTTVVEKPAAAKLPEAEVAADLPLGHNSLEGLAPPQAPEPPKQTESVPVTSADIPVSHAAPEPPIDAPAPPADLPITVPPMLVPASDSAELAPVSAPVPMPQPTLAEPIPPTPSALEAAAAAAAVAPTTSAPAVESTPSIITEANIDALPPPVPGNERVGEPSTDEAVKEEELAKRVVVPSGPAEVPDGEENLLGTLEAHLAKNS